MESYCQNCNRSFKDKHGLEQHIQYASAHKASRVPQAPIKPVSKPTIPAGSKQQAPKSGVSQPHPSGHTKKLKTPVSISQNSISIQERELQGPWSVVPESQYLVVLDALSQHCHSTEELLKYKYNVEPMNNQEDTEVRKCTRCGILETQMGPDRECKFHTRKRGAKGLGRSYQCCGTSSKGCSTSPIHDYKLPKSTTRLRPFALTPSFSAEKPKSRAVTIDCEMVGVEGGGGEVVFLCAAEYITGAILVNKYVHPVERVVDWRTRIHGIRRSEVKAAVSAGKALVGWQQAREELWKHIDDKSILIGHSLRHDLDVLRIVHPRIVDSALLASNAANIPKRQWGLQTLCRELLTLRIRNNDKEVHDCLEDVLATREVVLFCTQKKEELESWAKAKREEHKIEKKMKARERRRRNAARQDNHHHQDLERYDVYDVDDEICIWPEIAEDLGLPPGYDPWSD